MAKRKKYDRRGRRHQDSRYRKSSDTTFDDGLSRSQAKSFGKTKSKDFLGEEPRLVLGREYPIAQTMMTKRGKRVHLIYTDEDGANPSPLVALCGAGRPNKEFPEGSGVLVSDKIARTSTDTSERNYMTDQERTNAREIAVTCYKCLKINYMNEMAEAQQEIYVREFSPTNEGNRDQHVMIPAGRRSVFVYNADEGEVDVRGRKITREDRRGKPFFAGYDEYFARSRWHPGNEDMRTQPYSLDYVTDPEKKLFLKQFLRNIEGFGSLVRDSINGLEIVAGEEIFERPNLYENLQPVGSQTDIVSAYNKLVSLKEYRRKIAARRAKEARKYYRGRKQNPLIGMSNELFGELESIVEKFNVFSR